MKDWRLELLGAHEKHLKDSVLYKVKFPDFWKISYAQKGRFYQMILQDANNYVTTMNEGQEFLEGERIGKFWHAHCFCWEKATTDIECEFYCTQDFSEWICAECFHNFKEKFNWTEKTAEDLLQASGPFVTTKIILKEGSTP